MTDRILNLNQQIALLPAAIPDTVLDFLTDFQQPTPNSTEDARNAYDFDYLRAHAEKIKKDLETLRAESGKLLQIQVDQGGREVPGAFLLKLTFEKGTRGVGLLTKMKERTILRLLVQPGEYSEAALKDLLRNPPAQG